jgi:hypothetical protein
MKKKKSHYTVPDSKNPALKNIEELLEIIKDTLGVRRIAKRNNKSLNGSNIYAERFTSLHARAANQIAILKKYLVGNHEATSSLDEVEDRVTKIFLAATKSNEVTELNKRISFLLATQIQPAFYEEIESSPTDGLFPLALVANTRGYIEKIAVQACGCYDKKWYDASAVMCRRLLETLIIECFESHNIAQKIKKADGNFFYLRDLISIFLSETAWNIGRNAKSALPKLKDIGDQSAHSRRFVAHESDLNKLKSDLRITVQELIHLAKWNA